MFFYKANRNKVKYSNFLIAIHWLMAISFILMLASGLVMTSDDIEKQLKFSLYQWHKSLGLTLLITAVIRFYWRLKHKSPKLPKSIRKIEQIFAKLGHFLLYCFMFALPISGWILVSSSKFNIPTIIFNLFKWPHLPYIKNNKEIHEIASLSHELLAYSFILLISLHILAVFKHLIKDKSNLLKRMWF